MNWPSRTIGSVVDAGYASIQTGPFGTQLRASDYVESGTPVINVRNIGYGDLRAEKLEFVDDETLDRLDAHVLEVNDIVFGRKGAVDRHLLVSEGQSGWVQGSDCIRLRLADDRLIPRFVSYALLSETHKKWMLAQASNKATMASLNHDVVRRIRINAPPSRAQEKIVDVLLAYDDLIENNRRRIALLEQSARLLYREWFVHLRFPGHEHVKIVDGVPEGWTRSPFSALADYVNGYPFKPVELFSDGLPVIKIPELREGATDKTPRNPGATIPGKYFVEDKDLLFSWSGTLLVNFWHQGRAILNQHLFRVDPSETCSREFLYFAIDEAMPAFTNQTTGATMKHIRKSALDSVTTLLPHKDLMAEFQDCVESTFDLVHNLHQQIEKLRQARDLLLPRLMSGEIEV